MTNARGRDIGMFDPPNGLRPALPAAVWGATSGSAGVADHKLCSDCVDIREALLKMQTFEDFVRDRGDDLLRFASALTADVALAEDVVQDVLLRMHGDWERVAVMVAPEAYIRRSVVNEYLSWRRKWSRLVPHAQVPEQMAPKDHTAEHATRSELAGRIAQLPPRQRASVVMRYYADLSDREIGEVLGCRAVTVRGYISRALRTLRIDLSEDPDSAEGTGRAD